jgi:thioredoxin 2
MNPHNPHYEARGSCMSDTIVSPCPACLQAVRLPIKRVQDNPICPQCRAKLFPTAPVELTDHTFRAFINKAELPILVDVWAPWCGPCRQFAPTLTQYAQQSVGQLLVTKVNSDEAAQVAGQLHIRSIPTLILFEAGQEKARQSGALSLNQLDSWVRRHTLN